jgi:NAD(P)-dependent dehydrogenase (short-subunit alcohol dehydrogenase family)
VTMKQKTIIVTGASQGIGAAVANLFLDRGYNVLGNSRRISHKNELRRSDRLALVEGDIGLVATAEMIVGTALKRFGSVDALVNNATLRSASDSDLTGGPGAQSSHQHADFLVQVRNDSSG